MELNISIMGIVDICIKSDQEIKFDEKDIAKVKQATSKHFNVDETKSNPEAKKVSKAKRTPAKKKPAKSVRKLNNKTDNWEFAYVVEPKKPRGGTNYRREEFNTPYKFPIAWIEKTNDKVADGLSFTRKDIVGDATNPEAIARYELWLKQNGYEINRGTAPDGTRYCVFYEPKEAVTA